MTTVKQITALALLLTLIGCGGSDGPDRYEVNGTVSLDGEPVQGGTIQFLPQTDDVANAPTANGFVSNGEFRIVAAVGPIAGPNDVRIQIVEVSGNSGGAENSEEEQNEEENAEVVLGMVRTQVTIEPDGENTFEFNFDSSEVEDLPED